MPGGDTIGVRLCFRPAAPPEPVRFLKKFSYYFKCLGEFRQSLAAGRLAIERACIRGHIGLQTAPVSARSSAG